ncbi:MAG: hypothetical protein ACRD5J_13615 [Nitrososphaeraceae archaeon]
MVATLFVSAFAAATPSVFAGDINCDATPSHEYCTGKRGTDGIIFCDILEQETGFSDDCYDRENMDVECSNDGYEDGKNGGWDLDREHECAKISYGKPNPYRQGLEDGCRAAGYPKENCDEINH